MAPDKAIEDCWPLCADTLQMFSQYCQRINLLDVAEPWVTTRENSADLTEMIPMGFSYAQIPRAQSRGKGVAYSLHLPND